MANPQNPAPLWVLKDRLESEYPTGTDFQIALLDLSPDEVTIAPGDVSGTTISIASNPFVVGQVLTTTANLGTWIANTIRYVVTSNAGDIEVSTEPGGAAESLTGAAATISDLPLVNPIHLNPPQSELTEWDEPQTLEAILVKEIPDYYGLSTRPQVQRTAAATIDRANNLVKLQLDRATLDNTGGASIITFDAWLILSGGSTTPGDQSGQFVGMALLTDAFILDQSQVRELIHTAEKGGP